MAMVLPEEEQEDEARELELEEAALQAERDWLLKTEFPFVCQQLRKDIRTCLSLLLPLQQPGDASPRSTDGSSPAPELSKPLSFASTDSVLKGFIILNGWNIVEAEIQFSPHPQTTKEKRVIRAEVRNLNPLRLPQLQNAYNFLKLAEHKLCELEEPSLLHGGKLLPLDPVLEGLLTLVKKANDQFVIPDPKNLFPATIFSPSLEQPTFYPPVPEDIVFDFNFSNHQLVLSAYEVHITGDAKKGGKAKHNKKHPRLKPGSVVGQVFHSGSVQVEVLDWAEVRCSVPRLAAVYSALNSATKLLSGLRDKVIVLQ